MWPTVTVVVCCLLELVRAGGAPPWPAECPLTMIAPPVTTKVYKEVPLDNDSRDKLEFSVKACSDVFLALSDSTDLTTNTVEIALSPAGNNQFEIRPGVGETASDTYSPSAADSLSCTEFRTFWMSIGTTNGYRLGQGIYTQNQLINMSTGPSYINHVFISSAADVTAVWVFEEATNGYMNNIDGVIRSPLYGQSDYAPDLFCSWVVEADNSKELQLSYLHMDLQEPDPNTGDCVDSVTVQDSTPTTLGTACGKTLPAKLDTGKTLVQITFTSNSQNEFQGFLLHYRGIHKCGDTFTGTEGRITSPRYPDPYPPYADCTMTISVTSGYRVTLTFLDFVLDRAREDGECIYDSVSVYSGTTADASNLLGRYCESNLPPPVTSPTHEMTVVLKSDLANEFRGFGANYAQNGCAVFVFGASCDQACSCNQTNTESCDSDDGACNCKGGWEGPTCDADTDECTTNTHNCTSVSETCVDTEGSFQCVCSVGYIQDGAGVCQECPENQYGDGCSNNCTCITDNTVSCDHVTGDCTCKAGWEGDSCENDVNECTSGTHSCTGANETCVNQDGGHRCDCDRGYIRNATGICNECPENQYGDGCSNSCTCRTENTASCHHVTGNCTCKAGWEGDTCETDVNECTSGIHSCTRANEKCVNQDGGHRCDCNPGFTRSAAGTCNDINECASDTTNNCTQVCTNLIGSYNCSCNDGYNSDGAGGCFSSETYSEYILGFGVGIPGAVLVAAAIGSAVVIIKRKLGESTSSSIRSGPSSKKPKASAGMTANGHPPTTDYPAVNGHVNKAADFMP